MLRQLTLFGTTPQSETDSEQSTPKRPRRRFGRRLVRRFAEWRTRHLPTLNQSEVMASSHRRPIASHTPAPHAVPSSLLEAIRAINASADLEYLAGFDESALRLYLAHLESSRLPRGRGARWERPGDTRAISMCRTPEEL